MQKAPDAKDLLFQLLLQASTDDTLIPSAKQEYEKLVGRFDEEGMELEFPVGELDENRECSLQNLNESGYLIQWFRYHGSGGGPVLYVDLRGKRFLELANDKRSVVIGMQDSGKRERFSTGAVRDSADGKPRPDLFSPFAMERIGRWLELGARKYAPRNWERGMEFSRVAASLHRHLMKFMQHDASEDHLAAIAVNASFLMHYEAMIRRGLLPKELDDLPEYGVIPGVHKNGDEPIDY